MRVLSLLLALVCAEPTIDQLATALENVQKGLGALPTSPEGMDALQANIASAVATLRSDASDEDKRRAAKHAQEEIVEFKSILTARQDELEQQSQGAQKLQAMDAKGIEADTAAALFKQLLTVQDAPMDEQLKLVKSEKYAKLKVAEEVAADQEKTGQTTTPLAISVGLFLDGHKESLKKATPVAQLTAIEGSLEARAKRLDAEVRSMDSAEKAREGQAGKTLDMKGDGISDAIKEAQKSLKFFDKAAHHKFLKQRSTKVHEEADLNDAVAAIKKGDTKAVTKILESLKQLDPHPLI